ncbi:hypothetical protein K3G39_08895 [Pontibacter sp. HSC-14F20]|uniref:hypothetical protein n=1 Tax=Pontibacter sp. HSC-14F20 TaxID=2864136 RepID=UPI001C73A1A4|nr:hypothetical protein [Pontibacter sp. HSC-14F20]MBX0333356.1 hypothetical protein [Pontibacter sp. HSC-14F20]
MLLKQSSFQTLYSSDFYKVEVDKKNDLLMAEWLRGVTQSEMVTGGTKLYEALRDTGITRAVANAERLTLLDTSTKEWMSTSFYELLSQTSLQKLARVLPSSLFSKLALEAVATRAEAQNINRFLFKNFSNQKDALIWINQ